MAWWGKVVGGTFGFLLGGPLGALLGASLGHRFDDAAAGSGRAGEQERVQLAFFTATFSVMGHIAKADGRVSQSEIALAKQLMAQFQLDAAQRKLAEQLFAQGTHADFDLRAVLEQLRRECHRRRTLIQMFMEIQVQAAWVDGEVAPEERAILMEVAQVLGIARAQLEQLINMVGGASAGDAQTSLADAYRVLGVTKDMPLPEVRKAYRRLLSQHHPDKLVAKGLPEEMIKLANQKTHEIRTAWETVRGVK